MTDVLDPLLCASLGLRVLWRQSHLDSESMWQRHVICITESDPACVANCVQVAREWTEAMC